MKKRTIAAIAIAVFGIASTERFMAQAQMTSQAQPTQNKTAAKQPRAAAPAQGPTNAPSSLPNGATSINETYQDWVVLCAAGDKGRNCVMTQQQRRQDTNQLVLAVEFDSIAADEIKGMMVLPFGLRLADGVTLQVDDGAASRPVAFSTCLPAGCIVPLSFDAAMVRTLRAGTTLKLVAKAHDSGQDVALGVSLKGFAAAQDRAAALAKS